MVKTRKKVHKGLAATPAYLVLFIFIGAIALVIIISKVNLFDNQNNLNTLNDDYKVNEFNQNIKLKKFDSLEDFNNYLALVDANDYFVSRGMNFGKNMAVPEMSLDSITKMDMGITGDYMPNRISNTNVQVVGIDEPDILKTNGQEIFFSGRGYDNVILKREIADIAIVSEQPKTKGTAVIDAWPIEDLKLLAEIDLSGEMLLSENNLVVFNGQNIQAFDISKAQEPNSLWQLNLENNTYILNSRLYNGKIYLITQTYINRNRPCPLSIITNGLSISCTDIYHLTKPLSVDNTYVAMILDPATGQIEKKISWLAGANSSIIYMSTDNLYLSYTQNVSRFDFMFDFARSELKDLLSTEALMELKRLNTYNISSQSKITELQTILDDWIYSLDKDESMRVSTELENRMEKYQEKHKRDFATTGIIKIDLKNLKIKAQGNVPGHLLNQFSLDEYKGYLRVATTIGDRWGMFGGRSDNSANDVYVLDKNLKVKGSIKDLGLSEKIYSARFIGDKGYLVTFRQVDPFYVLDLSNPKKPAMVGELKIPGYSSYLHPVTEDRILGIGMEERKVKISYFDVSNPNEPKEIDKYFLDEYGSEALYNQHAFLLDPKYEVFFLPSYKGGYVLSYANDKLALVKTLNLPNAKRALYLDNYMYILSTDYLVVLDEDNWEKVNELDL